MATKTSKSTGRPADRKPRADAQRNRERILEMAKKEFKRSGANASLEEIGRQAGVGPGTMYRHFPTRDALIEAVYRTEVQKLAAAAGQFSRAMAPLAALRAWMLLFIEHVAAKQIIAPVLDSLAGGAAQLYEGSRIQITGAMDALVRRGIESGELRQEIEPFDLLRALIGLAHVTSGADWKESGRRLVDILIAGSRSTA
jgi:AcrR family transcriptional regulator